MNPDIKKLWVDALRSGEYRQGEGRLRSGADRYCCLGVLTDLGVKAGLGSWATFDGGFVFAPAEGPGDVETAGVHRAIAAWAGTVGALGKLPRAVDYATNLAGLNDNGATFDKIADVIEEQL